MRTNNVTMEHVIKALTEGVLDHLQWPVTVAETDRLGEAVAAKAELCGREKRARFEAHQVVQNLSPREQEFLILLTRGFSNKSIAKELGISQRSVEIHRDSAFKKINAGSTADAVRTAVYAGLDGDS